MIIKNGFNKIWILSGGIFVSIPSFKWENSDGLASPENLQVQTALDKLKGNQIHKQKKLRVLSTANVFFYLFKSELANLEFSRGKVDPFTKLEIVKHTTNTKLHSYSQKVNEIKGQNSEILPWNTPPIFKQ